MHLSSRSPAFRFEVERDWPWPTAPNRYMLQLTENRRSALPVNQVEHVGRNQKLPILVCIHCADWLWVSRYLRESFSTEIKVRVMDLSLVGELRRGIQPCIPFHHTTAVVIRSLDHSIGHGVLGLARRCPEEEASPKLIGEKKSSVHGTGSS